MTYVGLRELKNNLSEYVRRAAGGEFVLVTDRGRVVAELRPASWAGSDDYPLLREAEARGSVRRGAPNNQPDVYELPPLEASLPPSVVETLLDELRGDN